jgi:L-seryl-tRNA(Ser) seleniumtransferase
MTNPYRSLPSVDRVLTQLALDGIGHDLAVDLIREALDAARAETRSGAAAPDAATVAAQVRDAARRLARPTLQQVINATGVIIHTNLGRAPLSTAARAAMQAVTLGYSNLEFDLSSGERGSRYAHLDALLRRVTGAAAGIAVNNNASALLLTLSSLAAGKEVLISRSQAVEIGGGFRIPDVMRQSGVRLVEVGTTNRTYVRDFAEAIGPETVAILRVHSSNFRISGFTTFPALAELAALAHSQDLLLFDDLGSGCLLPVEPYGLAHEPLVQDSLRDGADLALFSGDKLLGGPQAGIIAGRHDLLQQIRSHPLARAVRMDKASTAGLAATLQHYLLGEALDQIPVWKMIAAPHAAIHARALRMRRRIGPTAAIQAGSSVVGGGSLPDESLPTSLLALTSPNPSAAAGALRCATPPVICRIEHDRLLLDLRTVEPADDTRLLRTLKLALPL